MQKIITLGCQECKRRNYSTTKNTSAGGRMELKKYCRFCKKHTVHKEVK